ncbi:hypothetical protein [Streptomyces hygroscopicus]|uniref:hypothetical protein n=1 Tax=Streptomyces hygroscopicus TaxID=1912 RepID=UPI001FCAAEAC|nr:hypothetical protein [Streptomyces hygroscopicus]BDH09589.1 hypothetical protein HOK021_07680 [Streptomyces hygroscopicus]
MNGIDLLSEFVVTGSLCGLRIDSPVGDVDRVMQGDYIDAVDGGGLVMRRDYGLMEFGFNSDSEFGWVLKGCGIQLHRLPYSPDLLEELRNDMGIDFQPYTTWGELSQGVSHRGGGSLEVSDQDTFLKYRMPSTKVSVIVNNVKEERDDYVGYGDVWAVHLG